MVDTPKATNALQHLIDMFSGGSGIATTAIPKGSMSGTLPAASSDLSGMDYNIGTKGEAGSDGKSGKGGALAGPTMPIASPQAWMKQGGAGNFMPTGTGMGGASSKGGGGSGKGGMMGGGA